MKYCTLTFPSTSLRINLTSYHILTHSLTHQVIFVLLEGDYVVRMLVQQQSFGGRIIWYGHVLHWRACLHTVSGDWDAARENSLLTHHYLYESCWERLKYKVQRLVRTCASWRGEIKVQRL